MSKNRRPQRTRWVWRPKTEVFLEAARAGWGVTVRLALLRFVAALLPIIVGVCLRWRGLI